MTRLKTFLMIVGGAAVIAAPALAQSRLVSPGTTDAAHDELHAEQAAMLGDWQTSAVLAGRSYRASPSLGNEFTLANAYAHTGQRALAVPLYEDVAEHGEFVIGAAVRLDGMTGHTERARVNLADEAGRRLTALTGAPSANASLEP